MKKIFCAVLCALMLGLGLAGCDNEKYEELQKEYYAGKTAIIYLDGNLIAEGKLEKYVGYSTGACVLTIDGKSYQTHSCNFVIITDNSKGESNNADN